MALRFLAQIQSLNYLEKNLRIEKIKVACLVLSSEFLISRDMKWAQMICTSNYIQLCLVVATL